MYPINLSSRDLDTLEAALANAIEHMEFHKIGACPIERQGYAKQQQTFDTMLSRLRTLRDTEEGYIPA